MTQISEPKIQHLKLDDIEVDLDVRRRVSESTVADLVASVTEIGVMTNPIFVRKARRKAGDRLILIDGAHRLTAARKMGWKSIPVRVWSDISDDQARLMECDANFARAELNVLEKGLALLERKGIYENIHPETKAGVAGSAARWDAADTMSVASFAVSTAEKLGITDKSVRRMVAAVSTLNAAETKQLRRLKDPISLKDLMLLAKVTDTVQRAKLVDHLKRSDDRNCAAYISELRGSKQKPAADPLDALHLAILNAWSHINHVRNEPPYNRTADR